jgi:hypothetical protein
MKNNYADWLEYIKKEESATTGSLKLYYRRLKELNRDRTLILDSMGNQFDSALDTKRVLLDYINTMMLIYLMNCCIKKEC